MHNNRAIGIAAQGALPMAVLEVFSLVVVLTEFSRGAVDTKAAVFLVSVQGGILRAISLGVLGAVRRRPGLSILGAGLIFVEGVPLIFSFAWVAVLVSGFFLLDARDAAPMGERRWLGRGSSDPWRACGRWPVCHQCYEARPCFWYFW